MKSILFRADANTSIGMGDLMSVIYLSDYFDGWYIYFIVKKSDALSVFLEDNSIDNLTVINSDIEISDEILYVNRFVASHQIDVVFMAITERPYLAYSRISTNSVKMVCVNHYSYNNGDVLNMFDLVIDWDVLAKENYDVSMYRNTKFLLGPKYVILPKEVYMIDKSSRKTGNVRRLLVSMGGVDVHDLTADVVACLLEFGADYNVTIILGAGYPYRENLDMLLSNNKGNYVIKQNLQNMFEEFLLCDVAIVSGGLTASEVIACNTASLLIATEQHQIARCKYFDDKKLAKYLGYGSFEKQALINDIETIKNPGNNFRFATDLLKESIEQL